MKQIAYNVTKRTTPAKYIVIHTTGNPRKGADAEAHFRYWNGSKVGQSADFVVDDTAALQINDYTMYYTWHCGDGKGKYGITNANSVGIEICINSDGDYSKAVENTIKLTRDLMKTLNIPAERVVRHYDASRKICPAEMAANDWADWKEFKSRLVESEDLTMAQYEELKKLITESKEPVFHHVKDIPGWAQPTIHKLLNSGFLKGESADDLNTPYSMLRTLVILDRAGVFDKQGGDK